MEYLLKKHRCINRIGKVQSDFLLSKTGMAKVSAEIMKSLLERVLGTQKITVAPIPDTGGLCQKVSFIRAGVMCEIIIDIPNECIQ